jgi:hypothetical protein
MPGRRAITLLFVFCLASTAVAEKRRNWQMGQIIFVETRFGPMDHVYPGGNIPQVLAPTVRYTVASGGTTYVLEMRKPKKATLTGNRTVKFAIEKDTAFVVDDKGDELKLNIMWFNPHQ